MIGTVNAQGNLLYSRFPIYIRGRHSLYHEWALYFYCISLELRGNDNCSRYTCSYFLRSGTVLVRVADIILGKWTRVLTFRLTVNFAMAKLWARRSLEGYERQWEGRQWWQEGYMLSPRSLRKVYQFTIVFSGREHNWLPLLSYSATKNFATIGFVQLILSIRVCLSLKFVLLGALRKLILEVQSILSLRTWSEAFNTGL